MRPARSCGRPRQPEQMRAAIFDAPFAIRMAEAPKPEPQAGEVLVRVKAAGLCAGDLYIYTGKNPYVSYPRIGCHEIAGIVESLWPRRQRPGCRDACRRRPIHRLRPLLSLPCRQAQLLRQPDDRRRASRRRFRRFRHRPGRQFEHGARDPDGLRGGLRRTGGDRRARLPARHGHRRRHRARARRRADRTGDRRGGAGARRQGLRHRYFAPSDLPPPPISAPRR